MLEQELFDFLENTADATFTVDERGLICSWNHSAERLFGHAATEVLGKPCAPVLQGRDSVGTSICSEQCAILDCTMHDRAIADYDMEAMTRSGSRVWVNVSILLLHDQRTGHRLTVHLLRDIGEKKRREALLQQLMGVARQIVALPGDSERPAPVSTLSEQECKILRLLAQGKSPETIRSQLHISSHTLRNHLHNVNAKLHTRSRLEAVAQASRRGLI